MTTPVIRPARPSDEARWRELWYGYNHFYEREAIADITGHTWSRILDDTSAVHAIVADDPHDGVIGMANYVIHENTSALTPACYLQDLFVDPGARGHGVGKLLIDWLLAETQAQGWYQLYWHTREDNYRARSLYDKYTPHSGFLRYVLRPPR
ncbi:GNAT family N-acetyltransferase [Allorhizocola rhizosphaerae]|uniref:GNAT family N-acetyltransferase n=1 Tax=Allorhizocola rhizosphaerae TaxID=1872709 RepID=UPI000E3DA6F5|nr:GNAT family N-acetyltransferase [Allorhizocola rhizosphaerae]